MNQRRPTRRKFIQTAAVAATVSSIAATTSTSTSPTTMPADDIAALARSLGHDEFTADEQRLMAEGLSDRREYFKKLRQRMIDPRVEPAVQFNPRLADVTYPSGESSFKLSDARPAEYNGDPAALAFTSATDLSRLLHAGKITSTDLTKLCLGRLDTIGRRLNAVVNLTADIALQQAARADAELKQGQSRGPLHGIPYGAKDILATKDIPTTWGVKPFEHQTFDYDATVIEKLDQAGAVLCAKLSLGELAMGDVWFGGQTRSPWNPKEGSGGSSAGPAAAVASGCLPFAIGSETLGSIISPCMTNGLSGLRPTYGRVSRYGAMPLSRTMDKLGPLARSVEDLAMVLSAIHGPDDRDPTAARDVPFRWDGDAKLRDLRIGIDSAATEALEKMKNTKKRDALLEAITTLRNLAGRELVLVHLPPTEEFTGLASLTIAVESAASFTELVQSGHIRDLVQQDAGSWPNTFRKGSLVPGSDYLRAQQLRAKLQRVMHEAMKEIDVYVTIPYTGPTIAYTNLTGHPSVVTRCGMIDERPLTIEFVGNLYREDAALRLAFAYEKATSWNKTWPTV